MMKTTGKRFYTIAAAAMALAIMIGGCGGGGGNSGPAAPAKPAANKGYVSARVSFQGTSAHKAYLAAREGGRSAEQTISSMVVIAIAISGISSETGVEFLPITSTLEIDPSLGSGSASLSEVPIGVNHLLTAIATWPDGTTETVMCLIPEVAEGQTTQAYADEQSTAVATVAIAYAAQNEGTTLADVSTETITDLEAIIMTLNEQGTPFASIDATTVLAAMDVSEITITPPSATLEVGYTQLFT
ncbi:hypothetical protein ACFLQK_02900, partial [bacterium]